MKHLLGIVLIFIHVLTHGQTPQIQWQKCIGGSSDDVGNSICKTTDGNYIIAGWTNSIDGDVSHNIGIVDVWLIKIDSLGNVLMETTMGGTLAEYGDKIIQTRDSGFAIIGSTKSNDHDVSGLHNDSIHPQYGYDIWLVKTDSHFNIQWQHCFGGNNDDEGKDVLETSDGNYLIAAETNSSGGDLGLNQGLTDCWLAKVNSIGHLIWGRSFGSSNYDNPESCIQTSDGQYIITAGSYYHIGCSQTHSNQDAALIKVDTGGNNLWSKCYGSAYGAYCWSLIPGSNSTFYFACEVDTTGGEVDTLYGTVDFWIVKGDSSGNIIWENSFGGSWYEIPGQIIQTSDGGIAVVGYTGSNDGLVSTNNGFEDIWVIKIDSLGNFEWGKSLGGTDEEEGTSIVETSDGGFIVCGYTRSDDGDVAGNHGNDFQKDIWIVKLSPPGLSISEHTGILMDLKVIQDKSQILLRFFSKESQKFNLSLYDINGRKILNQTISVHEGINYSQLNCNNLPSGLFIVEIENNNGFLSGKCQFTSVN